MKPTLTHKPSHYQTANLLMKFAEGKPLSCDQLNFLAWHQRTLSNAQFDPVLKYYLKHYNHQNAHDHSFLLANNQFTADSIARFKRRLAILLQDTAHIELKFNPDEFLQFRALTYDELILYHGNQLLTGAPFYQGGIPQILFFQWGNLFGVAKYVILAEEKSLKSNVLIYFEDLRQRHLDECVHEYVLQYQNDLIHKMKMTPSIQPRHETPENINTPNHQSWFQIPKLTLSPLKEVKEENT